MSSGLVLALDQGTTSSRAILFDAKGTALASAQQELGQSYPQPGWVEHDPMAIWQDQLAVAEEAMRQAGVAASDLAAVGITNQRETTLLWDRATLQPLAPAIVWQDRRTAAAVQAMAQRPGMEALVQRRSGLVLDAYFSGSKLAWLLEQVPGARTRAERGELAFGTVDSWLIAQLTRGEAHVTDVSNASRTMLLGLDGLDWDEELLALWDLPSALLPQVVDSSGVAAVVADGLPLAGVPIAGIAGDQHAATFGQACFRPGQVKATYGTGAFLMLNVGEAPVPSSHRLLSTVAWRRPGETRYALEGSVFIAGAVVQWLRDGLGLIEDASEIEALATSVPDAGGLTLVPAFTGLGAPYWDPYARGTLLGITRGSTGAHVARAGVESIAFQVADVVEAMRADAENADSPMTLSELRVDGGAAANDLLMAFQADLLGLPVTRPQLTEVTALGVAYLAGLATGVWSGPDDIEAIWQVERSFEPTMAEDERQTRVARWRRAVERARDWAREDA